MLTQVHEHIVAELGHSSRTDTIFVVTALIFDLVVLGINSGAAAGASEGAASLAADLILVVFILVTLFVNLIAVSGLFVGRRTRRRLLEGLVAMYVDNQVDKYYNPALLSDYGTRYLLFTGVIVLLGSTAILIPLIIRFV
jgi:hypothetical protein